MADLTDACFTDARLEMCELSIARLVRVNASNIQLSYTPMIKADASQSVWDNGKIQFCDLSQSKLDRASLRNTSLYLCDMDKVSEEGTLWTGTEFSEVNRADPERQQTENRNEPWN